MEDLMKMVGIEAVKETFLNLVSLVTVSKSTTMTMTKERLGAVFTGNPGTGKTTAARLYGQFLASLGMVSGKAFEETSGEWLYAYGVKECKRLIDIVIEGGGGVLFIDEAYPMAEHTHCPELNYILSRAEELAGKVVFVFAGYGKQMERFTTRNPGFASRIPIRFNFADFKDAELHHLLVKELKEKFGDDMAVEGGWQGRYLRVVARRIGRGRGKHGFGNAREVQNMASVIGRRYARRVFGHMRDEAIERDEWRTLPIGAKQKVLVAEDLVGPEPSKAFMQSEAWKKLSAMVGLESVKRALRSLVVRLQTNYERELAEEPLIASSLHKVFLGNPGTGKTTVARYYARILADMGLLTKGEVLLKDPSDFIGEYIGQSEANTRRILEAAKGNVLVIDEAYMLGPRYDGGGGKADCFKTAVIDTLVAQVQATGNDDMAVLLLGYREPMQTMLNNVNPGMARRFPLASAVEFEDYSRDDLQKILRLRLSEQSLRVSKESEAVALDVLERARNRLHFGNAGEIDILLDRAKDRQQERLAEKPDSYRRTLLEPQDFDPDFNRADSAVSNVRDMFKDYVGFKPIVDRLVAYQNVARNMKRVGMDPRNDIPFTYLFRGPPGTGKTSTARQVGKVFYDMGMLATDEVIECSASELIGEYIGQTGPKTQRVFSKALGKVLIIDEAYRLNESKFGAEATSEMVNLLTKTEYQNKLIVVLAGYEQEINALMDSNPGLTSRFPVAFDFPSLKSEQCFELLLQELRNRKLSVEKAASSKKAKEDVVSQFHTLAKLPAWGNARDVQTLAKQIMMAIMSSDDFDPNLEVSGDLLGKEIRQMVTEREKSNGIHAYNFYI
ncbi:ATPases of the AAA+ class [Thozetella sp. PMI_491]|nr:ATPases of the AAA+ class [Thozetella sp. PMI_491]